MRGDGDPSVRRKSFFSNKMLRIKPSSPSAAPALWRRCKGHNDFGRITKPASACWTDLMEIRAISKQPELGFSSCPAGLAFLPCHFFRLAGQTELLQLAGLVVGQLAEPELIAVSPSEQIRRTDPFFAATALADHVGRTGGGVDVRPTCW